MKFTWLNDVSNDAKLGMGDGRRRFFLLGDDVANLDGFGFINRISRPLD